MSNEMILWFQNCRMTDLPKVGGKNASLGEMISQLASANVSVPGGFATTAEAYRHFLKQNSLDAKITSALQNLDIDDIKALTETGKTIRSWIMETPFPEPLLSPLKEAYESMQNGGEFPVAVRSSATAEDLPEASFAGQQETFLNITGFENVLAALKAVYASLFNDRAISYRVHHGFSHHDVALSAGIQRMVQSDIGASGVMFTLDTESGNPDVIFITASYGLGECVVQGAVNPDEFYVHKATLQAGRPAILRRHLGSKREKMIYTQDKTVGKTVETIDVPDSLQQRFCLTDQDVTTLAQHALAIEAHYGKPMDIEWAKDGNTGEIFILQARPETVKSRDSARVIERYQLNESGSPIVTGRSIGQKIGQGTARVIANITEMDAVQPGDVLVTDMTDPDWEPVMKRASAIVTNRGGRTCHAAIIARELGIPAVVGCGDATRILQTGQTLTVSCAEGETGNVYDGQLDFERKQIHIDKMPQLPFKIMMNVGNPERALNFATLPNEGVGLARLEFLISQMIGIHPNAILEKEPLPAEVKAQISERTAAYDSPREFYIEKLREGIATLGAAFAAKPVIVRLSDFKSNEYANLLGGAQFEPEEENPMLGFRGASRYVDDSFKDAFAMECEAVKRVRNEMGLTNVAIMIPFVRTLGEARAVIDVLAENGLKRGENGLKVMMMCEVPSNAILAEAFLEYFDGFSIGSNDLTQLTLGLDRDSGLVAGQFDERDEAVKALLSKAIKTCRDKGKYIGICGQGPSDHPDLARWLMEQGIESVSLNPDSVLTTWLFLG